MPFCHLTKKSAVSKRFLGVTLAVNQIIAESLANSLQPSTVLNNKWIINFFILAQSPCSCSLCCFLHPRCVSSPAQIDAWAFYLSHKPRCKLLLVDPMSKSLLAFRIQRLWALSLFFRKSVFNCSHVVRTRPQWKRAADVAHAYKDHACLA